MSKSRSSRSTAKLPPIAGNEVDAFLEALDHPLRDDVVRVRRLLLAALPDLGEAIKWNAPSFRHGERFFATVDLRSTDRLRLVFHRGAKKDAAPKPTLSPRAEVLVEWVADDRALVTLDPSKLASQRLAFTTLVREWVSQLP
ncbi:MAG: DUF1801 domain-containing protein [Myxococcaceae bacterium]|nr:DUF1801 domain-containing protein [Myxococcaceae bacterium]